MGQNFKLIEKEQIKQHGANTRSSVFRNWFPWRIVTQAFSDGNNGTLLIESTPGLH